MDSKLSGPGTGRVSFCLYLATASHVGEHVVRQMRVRMPVTCLSRAGGDECWESQVCVMMQSARFVRPRDNCTVRFFFSPPVRARVGGDMSHVK